MKKAIDEGKRIVSALIVMAIAAYAAKKGVDVPAEAQEAFVTSLLAFSAAALNLWSKFGSKK